MLVSDIVDSVITRLSQVPGASVQTYATDRIMQYIQDTFDILYTDNWWPELCYWANPTLDGTTGVITTDLVDSSGNKVSTYRDVRVVYIDGTVTPLSDLPQSANPYMLVGTTPRYVEWTSTVGRPFRCWPLTATGKVVCHYRVKPPTFSLTDTVKFDAGMLAHGATWMYLEDDGSNPGQIAKEQQLFENAVTCAKQGYSQGRIELDPRIAYVPTTWQEWP